MHQGATDHKMSCIRVQSQELMHTTGLVKCLVSTRCITYITWIFLLNINHNCSLNRRHFNTYLQKKERQNKNQSFIFLPYKQLLCFVTYLMFISVINQLDAQNLCFTIRLFHSSTCIEHMCSSTGGQNCITQPLVSSQL